MITCSPRDPRFVDSNPTEDVKILSTNPTGATSRPLTYTRSNKTYCTLQRFVLKDLLLDVLERFFVKMLTMMLYGSMKMMLKKCTMNVSDINSPNENDGTTMTVINDIKEWIRSPWTQDV